MVTHETLAVQLARVETKVDRILRDGRDHETRIRGLERWRNLLAGAVTAVTGGITHLWRIT